MNADGGRTREDRSVGRRRRGQAGALVRDWGRAVRLAGGPWSAAVSTPLCVSFSGVATRPGSAAEGTIACVGSAAAMSDRGRSKQAMLLLRNPFRVGDPRSSETPLGFSMVPICLHGNCPTAGEGNRKWTRMNADGGMNERGPLGRAEERRAGRVPRARLGSRGPAGRRPLECGGLDAALRVVLGRRDPARFRSGWHHRLRGLGGSDAGPGSDQGRRRLSPRPFHSPPAGSITGAQAFQSKPSGEALARARFAGCPFQPPGRRIRPAGVPGTATTGARPARGSRGASGRGPGGRSRLFGPWLPRARGRRRAAARGARSRR